MIQNLVCLVIDEAHRAMGNYAYSVAVRELMAASLQLRILALSATPGSKQQTIQQIIDNLHISTLEYRNESDPDVSPYVHNRKLELIVVPMGKDADDINNLLSEVIRPFVAKLSVIGVLQYRDFQNVCFLLSSIGLRAMTARNEFRFRKQTKAAILIQARWRCHQAYSYYKSLQKAIIVTQCGWRCRVARKELRSHKMAARETGALKEAKDKLEKRVEELTFRLQLDRRSRTDFEEAKAQEIAKLKGWINEVARDRYEEMNKLLEESESSTDGPISEFEAGQIILGKRSGYVRGMGHSVLAPPKLSTLHNAQASKIKTLESELGDMQAKLKSQDEKMANMLKMIENLQRERNIDSPSIGHSRGGSHTPTDEVEEEDRILD